MIVGDHAPMCVQSFIFKPAARLAWCRRIEFKFAVSEHAAISEVEGCAAELIDLDTVDFVEPDPALPLVILESFSGPHGAFKSATAQSESREICADFELTTGDGSPEIPRLLCCRERPPPVMTTRYAARIRAEVRELQKATAELPCIQCADERARLLPRSMRVSPRVSSRIEKQKSRVRGRAEGSQ